MTKNSTLVVAAALVDAGGKILMQRRPFERHMGGLWEFPGGKLEPGESPEKALVRELNEELGIEVQMADLTPATFASATLEATHLILLLYVCRAWRGEPRALDASALLWTSLDDMSLLPMPPADEPFPDILRLLI